VVPSCNSSTPEEEKGGSEVTDQPGLHSEILAQTFPSPQKEKKIINYVIFIQKTFYKMHRHGYLTKHFYDL
jgi:hypothetical protein